MPGRYVRFYLTVICLGSFCCMISATRSGNQKHGSKQVHIDSMPGVLPVSIQRVARVTGKSLATETFPNPNNTDVQFNVGGTDLGIAWDMENGATGFFFGDTYGKDFTPVAAGGPGTASHWRSNVLAFSIDSNLADGLGFSGMALDTSDGVTARQIIHSDHITDGTGSHTAIPTAAIHANGADYVHYMDVRKWGTGGKWFTNFSSLYTSTDHGLNWHKCTSIEFGANSNFSQIAYAKKNGYVYMIGTQSGRRSAAFLSRFRETEIADQTKYAYWNKHDGWVINDESAAAPLLEAPVGELSLTWHTGLQRWLVTYLDESRHEIVIRDAKEITGPWTNKKTLVKYSAYPGLYGAFIHPLQKDNNELYFLMSLWKPYNVFLMKTTLKLID